MKYCGRFLFWFNLPLPPHQLRCIYLRSETTRALSTPRSSDSPPEDPSFARMVKMNAYLTSSNLCNIIRTWPDVGKHFSFIACVEDFIYNKKISEWEACFDRLKLNVAPIWECFESGLGEELEKKYVEETAALKPPHDYTPWVVVNGKHIDDFENTMTNICKAYKGFLSLKFVNMYQLPLP